MKKLIPIIIVLMAMAIPLVQAAEVTLNPSTFDIHLYGGESETFNITATWTGQTSVVAYLDCNEIEGLEINVSKEIILAVGSTDIPITIAAMPNIAPQVYTIEISINLSYVDDSGENGDSPGGGCTSNWECTEWSECVDGTQTRTCEDTRCGRTSGYGKPEETQECEMPVTPPTGVCESGERVCAADELWECQEEEWVKTETCEYGCDDSVAGEAVCLAEPGEGDEGEETEGDGITGWFLNPGNIAGIIIVIAALLAIGVWRIKK